MPPVGSPFRLGPKHLARAQRERLLSRLLLFGIGAAVLAAIVLVGVGIAEQEYFLPRRAAATVNGETITRDELGARVVLAQTDLLQQRDSIEQMMSFFAGSPEGQQSLQQQIARINAEINNPGQLAARVLENF